MSDENKNGEEAHASSADDLAAASEDASCKTTSSTTLTEMERLRQEAKEYKEKYLRALADLENSRKRLQREKQELMRYAIEQVVCDLLHPLDNLENALHFADQDSDEVRNWAAGFQMITSQFKDMLSNHGVSSFSSEGTVFDPHQHEAVEMEESDTIPEGTVIKQFVKGYKLGERVIRPARVKVSKAKQKNTD